MNDYREAVPSNWQRKKHHVLLTRDASYAKQDKTRTQTFVLVSSWTAAKRFPLRLYLETLTAITQMEVRWNSP